MALQTTGPLSLSNIGFEVGGNAPWSLRGLSYMAGKSSPDSFSEFYGYVGGEPADEYYYTVVNMISQTGPIYGRQNVDGNAYRLYSKTDGQKLGSDSYSLLENNEGNVINTVYGVPHLYNRPMHYTDVTLTRMTNGVYVYTVQANTKGDAYYTNIVAEWVLNNPLPPLPGGPGGGFEIAP